MMLPNEAETTKARDVQGGASGIETEDAKNKPKEQLDDEHKWFYQKYKLKPSIIIPHFIYSLVIIHGIFYFPYLQNYKTTVWSYLMTTYSFFGIGGGLHRYWCHRAFKAKTPLKIIFAIGYLLSAQPLLFKQWVFIHRMHHKYTDTDADPHSSKRGLFYSHIGWLMIHRPKEVKEKYSTIDMSDMESDPITKFCDRYFRQLEFVLNVMAVAIPVYMWEESWLISFWAGVLRNLYVLHVELSVNSFAHAVGYRPYDKRMKSADNRILSWMSNGEGWHNYHHVFPYDYRTSELGGWRYDLTGALIDFFEKIGWAYDLKKPNDRLVRMTMKNRGDGTLLKALVS